MQLKVHAKKILLTLFCIACLFNITSAQITDTTKVYKKKVLENTEIELLMSMYGQDGVHSPVNGGIGTEKLSDQTTTIVISIPLNADDVLTVDAGISAYTSASSSNINPWMSSSSNALKSTYIGGVKGINASGASSGGGSSGGGGSTGGGGGPVTPQNAINPVGTPWLASSGASHAEKLKSLSTNYSHSSDDRNLIWGTNLSLSSEYTYTSFGFGGNVTKLFNDKNTEVGLKGSVFLDQWKQIYPTEFKEYMRIGPDFQYFGYFYGVTILDQAGKATTAYNPNQFKPWSSSGRDSWSISFYGSQIISSKFQAALFFDVVLQTGMLSTPYHRIYFADKPRYYIGTARDITNYTSPANTGVYQLADAIETLPKSRLKIPLGIRMNYYINDLFVLRSYYRYYCDDWGLKSHTVNLDLPVKLSHAFTFTPSFRFYTQNQVKYFGPYETHLSTEQYFTSDYDLSKFASRQYSLGLTYTDIFTRFKIKTLGLKNINLKYSHYDRTDGLSANILTFGLKFVGGEK
jgi:Protein of unknown function (DUF3570)